MEVCVQLPPCQPRHPLLPLHLFDKSEIISVEVTGLPQSCPHPLGNVPHKEVKKKRRPDSALRYAGLDAHML